MQGTTTQPAGLSRQLLLMRMSRRDRLARFIVLAQDPKMDQNGLDPWDYSGAAQAAFDGWTNERQVAAIMLLEGYPPPDESWRRWPREA